MMDQSQLTGFRVKITNNFLFLILNATLFAELVDLVGKTRLVIDLSCRKKPEDPAGPFYVVTDKWTKYTDYVVT